MDDDEVFGILRAGSNLLAGGVVEDVAGFARALGFQTASQRMAAAIAIDTTEWMEERIQDLEREVQKLKDAGVDVRASDVRAVAEGIARAHRATADANKRKLLELAARHAFDVDVYNSGLTLVLLGMLEEMTYGDVAFLRTTFEIDGDVLEATRRGWVGSVAATGTLDEFHQERLVSKGLIKRGIGKGILGTTMLVTELGRKMLALLAEPADKQSASTTE